MLSRARRTTRFLESGSFSSVMASIHSRTERRLALIASAAIILAFRPSFRRMFSSQTSSLLGQCLHPRAMTVLAAPSFPANSSTRAAAIQPGALAVFGFYS